MEEAVCEPPSAVDPHINTPPYKRNKKYAKNDNFFTAMKKGIGKRKKHNLDVRTDEYTGTDEVTAPRADSPISTSSSLSPRRANDQVRSPSPRSPSPETERLLTVSSDPALSQHSETLSENGKTLLSTSPQHQSTSPFLSVGEADRGSSSLLPSDQEKSYSLQSGLSVIVPIEDEDETPIVKSRSQKCADCCKKFCAFLFSTIGLTCLLVGYTALGGFIFKELEAPHELKQKNNVAIIRDVLVESIWNETMTLNVFYPDRWKEMAEKHLKGYTREVYVATKRGWDGEDGDGDLQWTFSGSLLYSVTVITTIGYGHIAPRTAWGRVVTMLYAIVGIPLTLLTLANLGGFMAAAFRLFYKNVCCGICCCRCPWRQERPASQASISRDPENPIKSPINGTDDFAFSVKSADTTLVADDKGSVRVSMRNSRNNLSELERRRIGKRVNVAITSNNQNNERVSVPIYISLLLVASYICFGAVLFTLWEPGWDYLISSYFCFITLSTIGFGDFVPGTSLDVGSQQKLIFCSIYLLVGLAFIMMCFDLMQEEARNKVRYMGRKLGLIKQ